MEVHHHSHTPRQRWSHYFWEFFMLFLAVSLGFFVENQREHMVEHKREKQYIKSMTVDLAADTTKLSLIREHYGQIIVGLDSILVNYETFSTGRFSKTFFRYEESLYGFTDFIYTDRTINQLKSSGGMRLIRKQDASDSIILYDDEARDYLIEQEGLQRILNSIEEQRNKLINYRLIYRAAKEFKETGIPAKDLDVLLTHEKEKVEGFYNTILLYREALAAKKILAGILQQKATRLIGFLTEKYHLH